MSKGFASNYRIALLAVAVILCFAAIGTRLVFLHTVDREKYLVYVDKARREVSIEKARRGDIVDTHGDILATSRSTITLGVDPQVIGPEDSAKWGKLAALINVPYPELVRICTTKTRQSPADASATSGTDSGDDNPENPNNDDIDQTTGARLIRYAKIAEQIPESTYDTIKQLNIKGIIGTRVYCRVYPHGQLAAHLIGYVNKEGVPVCGLEAYANQFLFAADGWRESEKDGHQHELAQFRSRDVAGDNGYTVQLSIDSVVQNWAEQELAAIAQKYHPQHATIIISDAQTGFLLALADYPTFNLNEYNKAPMDAMKNYAITNQIDPGSTFKIVAASAALEEKLVTPDTRFNCSISSIVYQGKNLALEEDDHHWDHPLSVAEIISHSSNRGAAQLGMLLGKQRFYDYARKFGFGAKTGFPFGGEITGVLNPPEKWSGIDITRVPTGYSVSVTPIQIHYAMASIADGGELLEPQIIRDVRDAGGNVVFQFARQVRRRVISPDVAATMRRLLQGTASPGGTAAVIYTPGYQFAGKTGTAEKLIDGHYSKTNHVGSFVGFFPASNPRVVISVIVDDATMTGNASAYGAVVAAPSFKNLAEKLIPYLDIKPATEPATTPLLPSRAIASTRRP